MICSKCILLLDEKEMYYPSNRQFQILIVRHTSVQKLKNLRYRGLSRSAQHPHKYRTQRCLFFFEFSRKLRKVESHRVLEDVRNVLRRVMSSNCPFVPRAKNFNIFRSQRYACISFYNNINMIKSKQIVII